MEIISPDGATTCVVLAHPHPDYGGSMHAPVIEALFRSLPGARLRFDFGSVDTARADLLAAIDAVPAGLSVAVCGYSFGGDVALSVGHERITQWIALCPPLRLVPVESMVAAADARPTFLLVAEHDEIAPPERAASLASSWTSTTVEVIPGADHFLGGSMAFVTDAVARRL